MLVDAHMHVFSTPAIGDRWKTEYEIWEYGRKDVEFTRYPGTIEDAKEAIAESGYRHAIIANVFMGNLVRAHALEELPADLTSEERARQEAAIDASMPARLEAANEWIFEVAGELPDVSIVLAYDPTVLPGEAGAAHVARLARERGAKGIKIHPALQTFDPDDERIHPVYRTCVELGLTVLSHSGPSRSGPQYAEPNSFTPVLHRFPDLRLVLAHLGGGAWRQAAGVADAFPRAWFDLSEVISWLGAPDAPSGEDMARMIRAIGPERVLLGTDFPWYDLGETADRVESLPLLGRQEKDAILGENAALAYQVSP
jgi:uncharacterized protein